MSARSAGVEIRVGLFVVAALVGLFALLGLAGGGPSFLTARQIIEVDFNDGQGIRSGSPVRVAGIDGGRVVDVTLAEIDGRLKARVAIAVPVDLAQRLKQDVKITIQASLTGQSRVNIVSSGRSSVTLVPGQVVQGVETTFFDPILEQVGLGPVERSHLSHTIGEVRETVDNIAPRLRQMAAHLQETTGQIKDAAETVRPSIEATAGHVEEIARRIGASAPRIESTITRVESLMRNAEGLLAENRPALTATLQSLRELSATVTDIAVKDRVKVERLLDGLDGTRARADRVLYQADLIADQGIQILTKNKADIERTVSNVRDATDWADKLVQKIFANPFVLSPFYKPTPEDVRVQAVYDTAQVFSKGAKELNDAVSTLEAMRARPQTPTQREELDAIERRIVDVTSRLGATSQQLAEALKPQPRRVTR
ncbi:MAG: MlaD family protein [Isosphaeraceae bacterium]|nr:MlaD family protein [Isosphaeraceae bacterium]